jgi:phosphopantothenoylcysteine decarboxylase/phosphopantothenate--cysteine ligase
MNGKSILLIIGGGIAAYKSLELVRRLAEHGVKTRAILTRAGAEFITPLSVSALTGNKVFSDLFNLTDESEMGHIELSRAADLVVVAPATADLMGKLAAGLASDLASTALLATDKPILMVPAMNVRMWQSPSVQRNLETLKRDGVLFCGPGDGEMACGEFGPGRMAEPSEIVAAIETTLGVRGGPLNGLKALVTAGPTQEPLDPIRFLANHSSGKQGYAIAAALAVAGADVTLVSGPVALAPPSNVTLIKVNSARDMLKACEAQLPADIAVMSAAVADWRPEITASGKIKKNDDHAVPEIRLVENPDILATLARAPNRPRLVIGFAAETDNVLSHARAKRQRKGADWVLASDVSADSTGRSVMGADRNQIHLITAETQESWPEMPKTDAARRLVQHIVRHFQDRNA